MEYTWRDEVPSDAVDGRDSVILTAFPSAGLATIIAAHYMVQSLKLARTGRFDSPDLAPVAVVQSGEVNPTIRVYGRPKLALVLSEFPPTPSQANAVARVVLDAAERRGARAIICLEGVVPHPEDDEDDGEAAPKDGAEAPEQVWVTYAHRDAAFAAPFEAAKARPLEEGVIGGVSGALLVQGIGRKVPVAALLVSARIAEGLPDHRAGAALIETLDRILPELKIDTGPLRAQAEQIEKALRAALKRRPKPSEVMGEAAPDESHAPAPEMYR
jgi:predicted ATP-grasp superfamily ATP-dependent carboligase